MPTCVKFSGSPASNSLAKPHRIRLSNGPQPLAITNLPRWTIMAGPVRIASLCDRQQQSLRQKIIAPTITVESKGEGSCISMKTKKAPYDARFQVCYAAASQDAGVHDRSGIDACVGNRR